MDAIRNLQDQRAARAAHARGPEGLKTLSVPQAGAIYFGLGRNASYTAAARGEIPTVRIGHTLRVPVAALERLIDQAGA